MKILLLLLIFMFSINLPAEEIKKVKNLKTSDTETNVMTAFSVKSQNRNIYEMYAKIATKDKERKLSKLFQLLAEYEKKHATILYTILKKGQTPSYFNNNIFQLTNSQENLLNAITAKNADIQKYLEYIATAKDEGFLEITNVFERFHNAENENGLLLKKHLCLAEHGKEPKTDGERIKTKHWNCKHCNYGVYTTKAPKTCPLCGAPRRKFKKTKTEAWLLECIAKL